MNNFEKKVKNYIDESNLIDNKRLILAFSYGIDSRALLNTLVNLGYEVIIAHVNHKVRLESETEEKETIKLAKELNLKCYIKHLDKCEKNFEDYARSERYNFFKEIAQKENTNILLTAHHKDDNLETIILRLITGSNMYGYAGIHNKVYKNGLCIVRPFLCVSKDEIKEYQKECNFIYFEDKTNLENDHLRNRIRHYIIPLLKEESPAVLNKAINYSSILSSSFSYIRKNAISYYNLWDSVIKVDEYKVLDEALRKDILCYILEEKKINRNTNIINKLDKMLCSSVSQAEFNLENSYTFYKRYDKAYISKPTRKKSNKILLNFNEEKYFNQYKFYFSKVKPISNVNYIKLCYNNIVFPLVIRTRENGDRIKLSRGTKKIKDLFIDKKIDKDLRDELPIVLNKDEIIWIPFVQRSELIKPDMTNGDIYLVVEE